MFGEVRSKPSEKVCFSANKPQVDLDGGLALMEAALVCFAEVKIQRVAVALNSSGSLPCLTFIQMFHEPEVHYRC